MNTQLVGVAGSSPQNTAEWSRLVASAGATPAPLELGTTSIVGAAAWVVVLDQWQAPMTHGFWLRTLLAPIILITPYIPAAQALVPLVPQLRVISPPARAEEALAEMLIVAMAGTAGTLVVPARRFEPQRHTRRGVASWA